MNINDKIKQILIDKNYSPSYFADEIGVQRSSISHILSGRNRPSFDIIQKIIRRFPDLGYEWIMEEDSQLNSVPASPPRYSQGNNTTSLSSRYEPASSFQRNVPVPSNLHRSPRQEIAPVNPVASSHTNVGNEDITETADLSGHSAHSDQRQSESVSTNKKVERILIFYTDGSFREYTPSSF